MEKTQKKLNKKQVPPPSDNNQKSKPLYSDCCPPQKHHYNFGGLFLGIIIIAIGFLFLAQNIGWIDWANLNYDWWQLWPVLIIALGLSFISFRGWLGALFGLIITLAVLALVGFLIFCSWGTLINQGAPLNQEINQHIFWHR